MEENNDYLEWLAYYIDMRAQIYKASIQNNMVRRMMLSYGIVNYPPQPLEFTAWKIKKYRGSKALAEYFWSPEEFYNK